MTFIYLLKLMNGVNTDIPPAINIAAVGSHSGDMPLLFVGSMNLTVGHFLHIAPLRDIN